MRQLREYLPIKHLQYTNPTYEIWFKNTIIYFASDRYVVKRVRSTGFEPAGSILQQQPLIGQGTQGGTQSMSDPDLAKIVTIWPTLAPALKAAVLAIVQSK
jgi:hypothetical protein